MSFKNFKWRIELWRFNKRTKRVFLKGTMKTKKQITMAEAEKLAKGTLKKDKWDCYWIEPIR